MRAVPGHTRTGTSWVWHAENTSRPAHAEAGQREGPHQLFPTQTLCGSQVLEMKQSQHDSHSCIGILAELSPEQVHTSASLPLLGHLWKPLSSPAQAWPLFAFQPLAKVPALPIWGDLCWATLAAAANSFCWCWDMDSPFQSCSCSLLLHSSFKVKQEIMDQVEMQGNDLTGYYDGNSLISFNFITEPLSESVVSGAPHRELVTLHVPWLWVVHGASHTSLSCLVTRLRLVTNAGWQFA